MPNLYPRLALALACAAALVACHSPPPKTASAAPAAEPDTSGYAAPPTLRMARHSAGGGVELGGLSRPDADIRLVAPDATVVGAAVADHQGRWDLRAPAGDPGLFALGEVKAGRLIRSPSYIAILPAPGVAAVALRPGAGARSVGSQPRPMISAPGVAPVSLRPGAGAPQPPPVISAIDFDHRGGGVVSGLAAPGQVLRLQVDGADAGEGRGDVDGAYSISLADVLRPGVHVAVVRGADPGSAAAAPTRFTVAPAARAFTPPMSAERTGAGWRLDWLTPGGGVQTTLLFDTEPRS